MTKRLLQLSLFKDNCAQCMSKDKIEHLGVESSRECEGTNCINGHGVKFKFVNRICEPLPITNTLVHIPELPRVIDSLRNGRVSPEILKLSDGALGYLYTNVQGLRSKSSEWQISRFRKNKSIPSKYTMVFHQESKDHLLEKVFLPSFRSYFFDSLDLIGNCVLVSPGYAVYSDGTMCRYHQLYNLWRSIDFYVRATDAGLPCIPSIGWSEKTDLIRISKWLNLHPFITHLSVNMQTYNSLEKLKSVVSDIRFIESQTRKFSWVVFGNISAVKAFSGYDFSNRLHIATSSHIQSGRSLVVGSNKSRGIELARENRGFLDELILNVDVSNSYVLGQGDKKRFPRPIRQVETKRNKKSSRGTRNTVVSQTVFTF